MNYTLDIGSNLANLAWFVVLLKLLPYLIALLLALGAVAGAFVAWHRIMKPDPYHQRPTYQKQIAILIVFIIALVALVIAGAL